MATKTKTAPVETRNSVLQGQILARLKFDIGKDPEVAKSHDWLQASILAIRDRVIDAWMKSTRLPLSS